MDALVNVLQGEVLILHCHENGDCHAVSLRASSELYQSADSNALLKNEAVKEELTDTNTKAIERIKIGSIKLVFAKMWGKRRWCLAKNPAKLSLRWVM